MGQRSDLIRVYSRDKELINRIVGLLKAQSAETVSAGDVVSDAMADYLAKRPHIAKRPELAGRHAVQP